MAELVMTSCALAFQRLSQLSATRATKVNGGLGWLMEGMRCVANVSVPYKVLVHRLIMEEFGRFTIPEWLARPCLLDQGRARYPTRYKLRNTVPQ